MCTYSCIFKHVCRRGYSYVYNMHICTCISMCLHAMLSLDREAAIYMSESLPCPPVADVVLPLLAHACLCASFLCMI